MKIHHKSSVFKAFRKPCRNTLSLKLTSPFKIKSGWIQYITKILILSKILFLIILPTKPTSKTKKRNTIIMKISVTIWYFNIRIVIPLSLKRENTLWISPFTNLFLRVCDFYEGMRKNIFQVFRALSESPLLDRGPSFGFPPPDHLLQIPSFWISRYPHCTVVLWHYGLWSFQAGIQN